MNYKMTFDYTDNTAERKLQSVIKIKRLYNEKGL